MKADGSEIQIKPKQGSVFTLEEYQGYVGGNIEEVRMGSSIFMIVNEDGMEMKLPVNVKATKIYHGLYPPNKFDTVDTRIFGDVVLLRPLSKKITLKKKNRAPMKKEEKKIVTEQECTHCQAIEDVWKFVVGLSILVWFLGVIVFFTS